MAKCIDAVVFATDFVAMLNLGPIFAGTVDVNAVEGQKTSSGAQKETFGTGSAAQSEAGKKGGAISGTF